MTDTQEMICIGCPMGCALTVTDRDGVLSVSGNQCKIGEKYGREEVTAPTRNITTSISVAGGDLPLLSVKTQRPVSKGRIMDCVRAIKKVTARAPVRVGDVVLYDVAGSGVDVVATREVRALGKC